MKPNLLFIFTDQQRSDTLACYGNTHVQAPNLNALADQSFVFEHPYVTEPICTPARSTIMTGLYPHTTGCISNNIPLKPETPTLAEMVSSDYRTAYMGKWHLGNEIIAQHGFDEWVGTEEQYRAYYSKDEYLEVLSPSHHFLIENGFTPEKESEGKTVFSRPHAASLPEPYTKATYTGQQAARFIHENKDQPFVLYINFLEPHSPYFGPFNDMYPPEELPTGPQFMEYPAPNTSQHARDKAERFNPKNLESGQGEMFQQINTDGHDLSAEAGWRRIRARYMGLVTLVDKAVGNILTALDESGQADNTIVVFTSDHGDQMGDHHMLAKSVFYQESTQVPLFMRVPGLAGRQIPGRISQIDLVPTLLDLLGEPIPDGLQGQSRVDVLKGEATLDQNDAFFEWTDPDDPWRCIASSEGWKLNLSPTDQCEFYDLNTDPYEQKNLYDDPSQQDRIQDLTDRIRRWQEQTNDPLPTI
ncbi:MAG: sulfatase-like hydrolase/transferase [bacterium]|nr:sulfatase-like hydrolase/transferase [bacterium]